MQKQLRDLRLESAHGKHKQRANGRLDEAGDVAVAGLVQVQGAEDVIEEGRVVSAGSLTVRVEVHLQDLWLHHSFPWWHKAQGSSLSGGWAGGHGGPELGVSWLLGGLAQSLLLPGKGWHCFWPQES